MKISFSWDIFSINNHKSSESVLIVDFSLAVLSPASELKNQEWNSLRHFLHSTKQELEVLQLKMGEKDIKLVLKILNQVIYILHKLGNFFSQALGLQTPFRRCVSTCI